MTPITDSRAWILTYSGKRFYPFDMERNLQDQTINIIDIAHALSHNCRFTGHTIPFYSVAEHSLRISLNFMFDPYLALWGLLHDASEAYFADLAKPIKEFFPQYKEIEETIQRAVCTTFGLAWHPPHGMPAEVKDADNRMLKTEQRDLMPNAEDGTICPWSDHLVPYDFKIFPMTSLRVEAEFLARFSELTKTFYARSH